MDSLFASVEGFFVVFVCFLVTVFWAENVLIVLLLLVVELHVNVDDVDCFDELLTLYTLDLSSFP